MHFFRSGGLRCQMRMFLLLAAWLLLGPMLQAQTTTTTTTLAVSPSTSPLPAQTVVTLTATVTAGSTPIHQGQVTFCDATAMHCVGVPVVGTAQLTSSGTAVLRFIPGIGSHSYSAVFAGTTAFAPSTSTALTVTVSSLHPTTTSIASSGSSGNYTLTATVVGTGYAAAGPTGSVSFNDTTNANHLLGTAALGAATETQRLANAPGSPITVGTGPYSVAVGDFNDDGIADLAVVIQGSNDVTILLGHGDGTFTPAPGSPVAVGSDPRVVVVGDFNGDGFADMAVTNFSSSSVSILLGHGNGTFTAAPGSPFPAGNSPDGMVVADFNHDGSLDLAVTNLNTNTVSILLGNGLGGFAEESPIAVGNSPNALAVGDFNGDGIPDLAVANANSNSLSILIGNGSGGFTPVSPVTVGTQPTSVTVGDFNGDGNVDLAVADEGVNAVDILLGNGNGTFTAASGSPVTVGTQPISLAESDFNGDGFADLVVANRSSNNVSILLGHGNGTFTASPLSPVAVGSFPISVAVGDFNGDGIPEFTVANSGSSNVSVFLNQVTQTATAELTGVNVVGAGTTHEVNATYQADANFGGSTSPTIPLIGTGPTPVATTTTLAVSPSTSPLAANTVVTLTATVAASATPVHPGMVTFCDAAATHCTGVAVVGTAQLTSAGTAVLRFIPGSGSHSYHAVFVGTTAYTTSTSAPQPVIVSPAIPYPTTTSIVATGSVGDYTLTATVVGTGNATQGPTGSVAFVDTTNNNTVLGMATLGQATLTRSFVNATGSPITVGVNPYAVVVGDFNGDGIADVAVAQNVDNTVTILLGNGSGGFAPATGPPIPVGTNPQALAVGDFNGDGIADLAVANFGSNNVSILLGHGDGTFTPGPVITVGTNPIFVAVGDFNGDGIADLAVPNFGSHTVTILLGNGNGTFTPAPEVVITLDSQPADVAVGDFNGDGITDLAVADYFNHSVTILLGIGNGLFTPTPASPISVGSFPKHLVAGDFNGDGITDLAVADDGSDTVFILLGDGHGNFTQTPGSPISVGTNPAFMVVADFNGDGNTDLAVVNSGSDNVTLLLGDGQGDFTDAPGSPISVGSFPLQAAAGDFNGDGMKDLVVANTGATNVSILLNHVTQTATAELTGVNVVGAGTHLVHATYPGDTNFGTSTSPTTPLTGSPVVTATSLSLSTADTIAFGTPVILTAHVTPHTTGSEPATGNVTFHDGATTLGTVALSLAGDASITVSTFVVGVHMLTAVYAGDTNFDGSSSSPVSLTVITAPIAISLGSSNNPSTFGQTVTFTATVPSAATGTVQFRNGTANLGSPVTIAGGVATFQTSTLAPGTNSITAVYSGDTNHQEATSDALMQQVTALTTTTILVASPSSSPTSPLTPQTVVTLTATVMANTTLVSPGLVTFCDATAQHCLGPAVLGTAQLTSAGTAVLRLVPGSGNHSYIAVFAGTLTQTTSTSAPQAVTVSVPVTFPTTTSITPSGSAGNYTLTATVVGTGNATVGPTGSTSFIDTSNGNYLLGTGTLGTATLGQAFVNAPGSPVAVGHFPVAVAVGDFNGDGIPDLVVANDTDNALTILLGNGSGGFSPAPGSPVAVPVGPDPFGVVVGDFNNDGIADLAVANSGSTNVSILLGDGHGGFSPAAGSPVTVGNSPYAVAIGDFNGDGIADLAVANWGSNDVTILLGNGSGGFSAVGSSITTGGTRPYAITVGDFNGDGIADLAVANQTSANVSILLGNGSGGFSPAPGSPVTAGNHPQSIAVADFNGDGIADLAVTNYLSNDMNILLGDGHGGFSPAPGSPVTTGAGPNYVAVGDFNRDGITDLVVADLDANEVSIFLGDGHGGFTEASSSPVAVGSLPYAIAVADFNGDGTADLAVPNYGSNNMNILLNFVTQTATAVLTGVSVPGGGAHDVNATYPGDTNFLGSTSPTIPLTGTPVTTTTTLVLSTADTIAFGTPVTLTADAIPFTVGSRFATGTMSFYDGATLLGSAPISETGEASIIVSTFAVAVHTLTATYTGDANFADSRSSSVTLTVNPAPIDVSLISSANPSGFGQTVTFTATVPSGATGTIQFMDGTANVGGPVTLAGGVAAFTTNALMQGTHPIKAVYSGDSSHSAATSDVLPQLVTPAILTVTANSITRTFNQPNGTLGYTMTGFIGSDTQASSVTGTPTLFTTATQTSPVGSYPIVIGQGTLASSNYTFMFVNGTLNVTRSMPGGERTPDIVLVSSPNPSSRDESVTFGVTVPPFATGQVTFMDGAATLGTATIFGEAAFFSTSLLSIGTHPITAVYGGDTNYYGATSRILNQVVNKTTLQVTAEDAHRIFGQPNPTFTTTITGFVGGDTQAVVTGAPIVTTTATAASSAGVYPIVVSQGTLAAANYIFAFLNGSLTITQATPGVGPTAPVSIVTPNNPVPSGSPVTLTVTVPAGATGTVTFADGTTVLGTATIIGNTASLTIPTLTVGTHLITAIYSGDANFTKANSVVLSLVVVAAPDFTVASSTGRQLIPPGASANFTIAVSPMNGPFTNSVTMSASGLPPGATYTFSPPSVTPGAAGANSTFTVTVPPQSSMASRSRRLGPVAFALLLLPFACMKRYGKRPQRLLVWLLAALVSLGAVSGCGGGGYFSQTEQTYTITVTGTSGTLVRSTTVSLTVE